ncbi:MAG: N-acetyltransferase family protein [Candidatus Hodarchaeales archaeon]|jgi:predicted N-acetyltransferase YhbS
MSALVIKDLDESGKEGQYFASTCSHVYESAEIDSCADKRLAWFNTMFYKGLRVKVALMDGQPTGFLNMIPIEHSTWGLFGRNLMILNCLFVPDKWKGKDIGRELLRAAEEETRKQEKKALVTNGYYGDFWFMPASFFEKHGFSALERKKIATEGEKEIMDETALLWKVFDETAEPPKLPESKYEFKPTDSKVVIDLFWDISCQTSTVEAQRVKEVVEEFGNKVLLNEYPASESDIIQEYQISRAIYVNGREIGWGYEAPKDGIKKAIRKALENMST